MRRVGAAKTPGSAGMARRTSVALSGEKGMECAKWKDAATGGL